MINSARADPEKIRVLMMALFCRNTLCIARNSDEIRARIFREMPKANGSAFTKARGKFPAAVFFRSSPLSKGMQTRMDAEMLSVWQNAESVNKQFFCIESKAKIKKLRQHVTITRKFLCKLCVDGLTGGMVE